MRDFKGMKRQRGRNRNGGQGKPQQHNANRAFESNGPDNVKIRGNAQHVFEKYQQLARDASSSGDRVLAENYLQHAEHYFRVIRAVQPNRATADIIGRDTFASGYDIDFEDESGQQAEPEAQENEAAGGEEGGEQRQRQEGRQDRYENRYRDDRPRDDRPRDDRPRDDRQRDDRPRDERPRDDRPREDRQRDGQRDDRPQRDRNFNRDRDRDRDRNFNRDDRRERNTYRDERPADPMAVVEPQATPLTQAEARESSPILRSQDGAESHAPAFLRAREPRSEPAPEAAEAAPKPKRGRKPKVEAAAEEA